MSVCCQGYTIGHLETKGSVRISRIEVWRPGIYFQTNANTFLNKHLFLSHTILLPCDIYICIWNKKRVLLHICSLGLSRAQGLSVGLECTLTLNIYLCTNQHWTQVLGPLWGRDTEICLFICVSVHLQASTTFYRITIMQSQLQLLQITTDCKVNVFGAFPITGTKNTRDVCNVCFDSHVNGNDDGICINSAKVLLQREELGFFLVVCVVLN